MRLAIVRVHPICLASAVLVAACSGGGQVPSQQPVLTGAATLAVHARPDLTRASSGAVSPVFAAALAGARLRAALAPTVARARGGFTYVTQFSGTPVQEYHLQNPSNGPAVCSLPGTSVNGIAVDAHGDVWVPSGTGGGQGTTQEYGPGCGAAKRKIVSPNGQPADVAFDHQGHAYILNIFGAQGAAGSVNVYNAAGSVIRNLTDPSFNELIGIATNGHDDVFVSNRSTDGTATVVEFTGGKMPGTLLGNISLGLPGGPTFDKSNNLIISDWEAYTLNVYAPPYTGSPTVTSMQGLSLWCSLNRSERLLSCADLGSGAVDVYAYPGATYQYSYNNGLSPSGFASGIADRPAAPL
jgi:hypothetical protein